MIISWEQHQLARTNGYMKNHQRSWSSFRQWYSRFWIMYIILVTPTKLKLQSKGRHCCFDVFTPIFTLPKSGQWWGSSHLTWCLFWKRRTHFIESHFAHVILFKWGPENNQQKAKWVEFKQQYSMEFQELLRIFWWCFLPVYFNRNIILFACPKRLSILISW